MKCPDCGTKLASVTLGREFAYRCRICGGIWLDWRTEERTTPEDIGKYRRVSVESLWFHGGSGRCPQCNIPMHKNFNDDFSAKHDFIYCVRCGKHWWSGNSFVDFLVPPLKRAWRPAAPPRVLFLSLLAVLLAGGVGMSVYVVQQGQRTVIEAKIIVTNLRYIDGEILFTSRTPLLNIGLRMVNEMAWGIYEVEKRDAEYAVQIGSLKQGVYELRIAGEVYRFEVGGD